MENNHNVSLHIPTNAILASEQIIVAPASLIRQAIPRPTTANPNTHQSKNTENQVRPVSAHHSKQKSMVSDWSKLFYYGEHIKRKHGEVLTAVSSMGDMKCATSRPVTARPSNQNSPQTRPCSANYSKRPKSAINVEPNHKESANKIKPKVKVNTNSMLRIMGNIGKYDISNLNAFTLINNQNMISEKDIVMIKNVESREKRNTIQRHYHTARPSLSNLQSKEEPVRISCSELNDIKSFAELLIINSKFASHRDSTSQINTIKEESKEAINEVNIGIEKKQNSKSFKKPYHQRPQSARLYNTSKALKSNSKIVRFNNAALDALQISKRKQDLQEQKNSNKGQHISHKRAWSARNHKFSAFQKACSTASNAEHVQLTVADKDAKPVLAYSEYQATLPSTTQKYPILHSLDSNSKTINRIRCSQIA